jgi:hypothetical protein
VILFIDTEWADVLANELVSLALVSDCGRYEFYAERDPLPDESTEFVRTIVYPLLERGEFAMSDVDFTRRLHAFFGTVQRAANPRRVSVAYDHRNDLDLLGIALDAFDTPHSPPRPAFEAIELAALGAPYTRAVEACFIRDPALGTRRHHALIDARVNRDAWLSLQGRTTPT